MDETEEISLVLRQVESLGMVFERIGFVALFVKHIKGKPHVQGKPASVGMTGFSVGSSPLNDRPIGATNHDVEKYYNKTNMKKALAAS